MKSKLSIPLRAVAAAALAAASLCAQAQGPSAAEAPASAASAAAGARPELVTLLQTVQGLNKDKKYADALAKLREADALPNLTAYERHYIERMRAAAALGAGDNAQAIKSLEASLAGGGGDLVAAERVEVERVLVGLY